ncbi:MAG: hypothetical protein ACJLUP_17805 [Agrobacterium tumefaciens]
MGKVSRSALETAIEVLAAASKTMAATMIPSAEVLVRVIENSSKEIDAASGRGIEELRQEIAKQELRLGFDTQQARIAQELAIAHRITNAEIVEIEEFYDKSGSGQAGLGVSGEGLNLGLRGDGKSVVKRIYKFSGHRNLPFDIALPAEEVATNTKS